MRTDEHQSSEIRDRNSVQSVERAIHVLAAIARSARPLSPAEIASSVGLSRTAAYRLLRALEKTGAVTRLRDGRHEVGYLLRGLGAGEQHAKLRLIAAGTMLALRGECGDETVGLYVPISAAEFICIETIPARHPIHHVERLYRPIPIARGATSLVLLADALHRHGAPVVRAYLGGLPEPVRPNSIEHQLRRAAEVAGHGYATSAEDRTPDSASVSVPILEPDGQLVGALTVSTLVSRFDADSASTWATAMRSAAQAISAQLVETR